MTEPLDSKLFKIIVLITGANLLVLAIRDIILENKIYDFLLWNLFLGFLPLLLAYILWRYSAKWNKYVLIFGSLVWLFFYPNSPYMISDLMHVDPNDPAVLYDTLILFSFAMLSLFYGFLSLKFMYALFKKLSGKKLANMTIIAALVLSSVGFYLGRVLRLNSWDIFTEPFKVMHDVFEHLWPISKNPSAYIIMLLFGGIQFMLLIMMKDVNDIEGESVTE